MIVARLLVGILFLVQIILIRLSNDFSNMLYTALFCLDTVLIYMVVIYLTEEREKLKSAIKIVSSVLNSKVEKYDQLLKKCEQLEKELEKNINKGE